MLTLVRFGRFDEILAVTNRPKNEITGALWDFAQGYAQLRQGSADFARVYLARVKKTADTSTEMFRVHTAKNLLGVVAAILDGEIRRSHGDLEGAIRRSNEARSSRTSSPTTSPNRCRLRRATGWAQLCSKRVAQRTPRRSIRTS